MNGCISFLVLVMGFEPTYEELKRYKNSSSDDEITSFEPTYEELKHSGCRGYNRQSALF